MKKRRKVNPELKQVLAELEDVVTRLGFKVRYEKGNFEGGYCILKESKLFVINTRTEPERRVAIISKGLKEIGIEQIFIKPQIREIIINETIVPVSPDTGTEEKPDEETGSQESDEEPQESLTGQSGGAEPKES